MNKIFDDQKEFVDMPMKYTESEILENFARFIGDNPGDMGKEKILGFVHENFEPDGAELRPWSPPDWIPNPQFIKEIQDSNLREFATELNSFWKELGREMIDDVKENPHKYSIAPVTHPTIVPGGRFKEFYYWDSYWIQRGLLHCEMQDTVRGMILNFVEMVQREGYVPNGGRIYFTRSQPPLLIQMVQSYYEATGDLDFVREIILSLEKEFVFFMKNRLVTFTHEGRQYTLARYNSEYTGPRPESYM